MTQTTKSGFNWPLAVAAVGLGLAALSITPALADRLALWNIVNGKCVPHWQAAKDPSPCLEVDIKDGAGTGVAILKDLVGVAQLLAIPTRRITGIEDAQLLAPDAPDVFGAGWQARHFAFDRLGKPTLPRDAMGLAINSSLSRSQDQSHIHVDCLRTDIRAELAKLVNGMVPGWSKDPWMLDGRPYQALRVDGAELRGVLPFKLVAAHLAEEKQDIGNATIVAVGETFGPGKDGFVVLVGYADAARGDVAHGEDLLDHECAVAKVG